MSDKYKTRQCACDELNRVQMVRVESIAKLCERVSAEHQGDASPYEPC